MTSSRRTSLLALAAITSIAALLRLVAIGSHPLWGDEALTLVIAHAPFWDLASKPIDPTGPLYYWLHQLLLPGSPGPALARSISVAAGIVTVPLTYAVARTFLNQRGSLLSAALVGLSPTLIDYSQEARAYALVTMLCAAAAWCLLRADGEPRDPYRRGWLAGFVLFAVLALYGHLAAVPFVATALLVVRIAADRTHASVGRGEAYACWAAVTVFSLIELWRTWLNVKNASFIWLRDFDFAEVLLELARQWLPFADGGRNGAIALAVFALFAAVLIVNSGGRLVALARKRPIPMLLVGFWLLQPIGLWLMGMIFSPVFMTRTVVLAWPASAMVVAVLLSSLDRDSWRIAAATVVAIYAASLAATGTMRVREDWAGVAGAIDRLDSDLVIICPSWKAPALISARQGAPTHLFQRDLLVRAGDGNRDAWAGEFYEKVWSQSGTRQRGDPRPLSLEQKTVRSVTVVDSECTGPEAGAVGTFLTDARVRLRLSTVIGEDEQDAALGEPARINVTHYILPSPKAMAIAR